MYWTRSPTHHVGRRTEQVIAYDQANIGSIEEKILIVRGENQRIEL